MGKYIKRSHRDTSKRGLMGRIEKRERLLATMVTYGLRYEDICEIEKPPYFITELLKPVDWVDAIIDKHGIVTCITPNIGKPYLKHAIKRVFRGREHKKSLLKILQYMYSPLFPFVFGSRYFQKDGEAGFYNLSDFTTDDVSELVSWFRDVAGIKAKGYGLFVTLDEENYRKLMRWYKSDERIGCNDFGKKKNN